MSGEQMSSVRAAWEGSKRAAAEPSAPAGRGEQLPCGHLVLPRNISRKLRQRPRFPELNNHLRASWSQVARFGPELLGVNCSYGCAKEARGRAWTGARGWRTGFWGGTGVAPGLGAQAGNGSTPGAARGHRASAPAPLPVLAGSSPCQASSQQPEPSLPSELFLPVRARRVSGSALCTGKMRADL